DVIDKIKLPLPEQQELRALAVHKADLHRIEVRQRLPRFIFLEIMRVLMQDERLPFVPVMKSERTGTAGMLAEILSVLLYRFMRHHGAILHAQNTEYRVKRLQQPQLKSAVIQSAEAGSGIYFSVEYPGA